MRAKRVVVCLIAAFAATRTPAAETPAPAVWETKPDIAGIAAVVPPLVHPFPGGWHTTLFWWSVPLSFGDPARLKEELQTLAERGLTPCLDLCADYEDYRAYPATPEKTAEAIAQAKAVAAAGYPVHFAMKGVLSLYHMPGGKLGVLVRHTDAPGAGEKDAVGQAFPCLVLKDGWYARAAAIGALIRKIADAGVPVAGVWYDYEGHPHPWNGIFEHSRECGECRKAFPEGVLDDRSRFLAWCEERHTEAIATAFAKPVRESYPKALIGFYGYTLSSKDHPYTDWCGVVSPASYLNPAEIDAVMPVCYAQTSASRRYYNADWPIPPREMDAVYFATILRAASRLRANIRPDQFVMPFISSWCMSAGDERVPRMSKPMYREFLRHAILRGARGFYCFNVAPPYGPMADFYGELAEINIVYNELFAHRDLLEGSAVMNDAWADPKDAGATVWSGLRKGDKALIRALTLKSAPEPLDIVPFPGVAVRLLAQPGGATYVVDAKGKVQAVE